MISIDNMYTNHVTSSTRPKNQVPSKQMIGLFKIYASLCIFQYLVDYLVQNMNHNSTMENQIQTHRSRSESQKTKHFRAYFIFGHSLDVMAYQYSFSQISASVELNYNLT